MKEINKEKDYNLSLIRFIAMFMVIFCHIFEQIGYGGYSIKVGILGNFLAVGVQIFLILSGYLYGCKKDLFEKDTSRIKFISKNFKKILIDYYVYVIFVIIPIYYFRNPGTITIGSAFSLLTFSNTFHGVNHLWFIPYIIFCYILTPLFYDLRNYLKQKSKDSKIKYVLYVIIWMILIEIFGYAFRSYFAANRINCYFIGFFLLPLLKEKIQNSKLVSKISLSIVNAILLFGVIYFWYILRYNIKPNIEGILLINLVNLGINYSCFFQALTLFYFYYLIGKLLTKYKIIKRILDFSDKYSFDIYICHMIYVKGTFNMMLLTSSYKVNILLAVLSSIISGIILNYVCRIFKKKN